MSEDKKFTFDEDTLEAQREKAKDLIEGDKKAIEENVATARNPKNAPYQRQWAETRNKGIEEGLNRHQQQYAETEERLRRLSDESQDE